jgi:uracil-DNA glycosylase family 4
MSITQSAGLARIAKMVAGCRRCGELAELRDTYSYQTVPGEGRPNARLMVLGEAPGQEEAESGRPFVGKAGKLLGKIFERAGWRREDLFIANILKCRPPGNRTPLPQEALNCRVFLDLQIRCVNPQWILCLGKTASIYLMGKGEDKTMGSLRGEHEYQGRKVVCTYHPSYLLRGNEDAKRAVWEDIQPIILALQPARCS